MTTKLKNTGVFITKNAQMPDSSFSTSRSLFHIRKTYIMGSTWTETSSAWHHIWAPCTCTMFSPCCSVAFMYCEIRVAEILLLICCSTESSSAMKLYCLTLPNSCPDRWLERSSIVLISGLKAKHGRFFIFISLNHILQHFAVCKATLRRVKLKSYLLSQVGCCQ